MIATTVLAIGFASPALLGWLVLASLPILIHWLFRRRGREVQWAAMQFLVEAARKQSRRTQLEKLLLLITRMLIVACLVLAFARPRWSAAGKDQRIEPATLRVVVIDASLSMGYRAGDRTLFEVAKSSAKELVRRAREGDRFALARVAGSDPRILVRQPTFSQSAILEEIDRLPLTHERGDVAASLNAVLELLRLRKVDERCEVSVFSDFQADNWEGSTVERPVETQNRFASLYAIAEKADVVLISADVVELNNATLRQVGLDVPFVFEGEAVSVSASVRNSGAVPIVERRITLWIDDQLIDSQTISVLVGQDSQIELRWPRPMAGDHAVVVRLEDDALAGDNQRWLSTSVRSRWNVLLVNGRPSGRPRDAATFFVEQALSPRVGLANGSPTDERNAMRVTTVLEGDLANLDLKTFDVIFLCETNQLFKSDVTRLRSFVQQGGGLVLSLGPSMSLERTNETVLGTNGLMNIRLTELASSRGDSDSVNGFGFDPGDWSHELLREFRGNPGAGLETALIHQYARSERNLAEGVPVETALAFSSGDPAVLTQSLGRGRCLLVTTSLDESWGEWVIWAPGFVPLIHEIATYAAAGGSRPRELLVGEALVTPWPHQTQSSSATVTQPNGSQRQVAILDDHDTATVVFREALQPGLLTVSSDSPAVEVLRWSVNVDPRESDPRRLDNETLVPKDRTGNSIVLRQASDTLESDLSTEEPFGEAISRGLLFGVLALLLVEQGLAWKLSLGVLVANVALILVSTWFSVVLGLIVLSLSGLWCFVGRFGKRQGITTPQ